MEMAGRRGLTTKRKRPPKNEDETGGLSTNQTRTRKGSVLGSSGERELKGRTGQPKTKIPKGVVE